ncbi:MAG: PKD domain-containing protein [Saprospiraceae bacterium]|nr:PKD domain-containing protein [Saprospiraceae bacterium]
MTSRSKQFSPLFQCVVIAIIALIFSFCKREEDIQPAPPSPTWQNTFTPILENNYQRDTVYDDEYITFSTSNTPSDRYIWSWGDGSKSDTTQTNYAFHQYSRIGMNIIKLRVERGNTYGEKTDSIWVIHRYIPPCGFRIDSYDSLYVQDTSHFVANISTADCQSTCNFGYQWDFGDGSSGTGYHTTHSYNNTGNFLVKVRITRCGGSDTIVQKQIVVGGDSATDAYKCLCVYTMGGNSFSDTIHVQNLPYNPIKVEGRILHRSGNANHYFGDHNCNPNGCETYILDVFNNLDSIQYKALVAIPWGAYTCSGKRL